MGDITDLFLCGTYERSVDSKFRLSVPSALSGITKSPYYYVSKEKDGIIRVYPKKFIHQLPEEEFENYNIRILHEQRRLIIDAFQNMRVIIRGYKYYMTIEAKLEST